MPRGFRLAQVGPGRVQRALYFRCRRGDREALATLLYRVVDRAYTAASFVVPDEETACEMVAAMWEDLLALLLRWHVGGHLHKKAERALAGRLAAYADPASARRAVARAARESEDELLVFPTERLSALLERIPEYAPRIAAGTAARVHVSHRIVLGLAVVSLAFAGYGLWLDMTSRGASPDVRLECLQKRIVKADLIAALRDTLLELPDREGADGLSARVIERSSLALEEIANARNWRDARGLRYLVLRLRRERLSEQLAELATEQQGVTRRELAQAQLILEEVENL